MKLLRWTHLHTFVGGAAFGLALVHWWLTALFLLAAVATGVALGVLAARGAWSLSGRAARWLERGRQQPAAAAPFEIPPGAEVQLIVKPRPSRYDRARI